MDKTHLLNGFNRLVGEGKKVVLKFGFVMVLSIISSMALSQITGTVSDENGDPLAGATVLEVGTSNGVITNVDGSYQITPVGVNPQLQITFVGYETQIIDVGSQTNINVGMDVSSQFLDDVVVVGYGVAQQDKIGSSISQMKSEEIEKRSAGHINIESIIGGQIKGVQLTQSTGAIGAASTFNIRGITSPFGSSRNQPLIVIDDIPFFTEPTVDSETKSPFTQTENPLLAIEPDNIESVSVLKDAAATAIYGSRGANGVIIITTKRGKRNSPTRITLKASSSISNPIKLHDVLGAEGYRKLHTMIANNTIDAYENGGYTRISGYRLATSIMDPVTRELRSTVYDSDWQINRPVFGNASTDWQDVIYRDNANSSKLNLNIQGGKEKTNYSAALSYDDQNSLMVNSEYKRYGIRLAMDSDVKDWLAVGTTLNYNGSKNNTGLNVSSNIGATETSALTRPDYPIYDEEGFFTRIPFAIAGSSTPGQYAARATKPHSLGLMENTINRNTGNFLGSAYVQVSPLKDLKVKADFNAGLFKTDNYNFTPIRTGWIQAPRYGADPLSSVLDGLVSSRSFTTNLRLNYDKSFGDHTVNAMAGGALDRAYYENKSYSFRETPDDYVLIDSRSASVFSEVRGGKNENGINSMFSRVQYDYKGKYTATLNFRTDKSTKFGPGKKRGYFPSVALNWNISDEKFMENAGFVSNLALRASLGKTGSTNVNDFSYLVFFERGLRNRGTYADEIALNPDDQFPNPVISWESTTERNLGLDYRFLSNRIYGSLDLYRRFTSDILSPTPIFVESGHTKYTSNLADISNTGMELEIGGDIIQNDDVAWSVNLIYAKNKGIVEELYNANLSSSLFRLYQKGARIGDLYGRQVEGIFQSNEEVEELNAAARAAGVGSWYQDNYTGAGDFKFKDVNGDGRITSSGDYTLIGNSQPDYFGGFSTNLRYKNFNLFGGFQYAVGVDKRYQLIGDLLYSSFDFENMGTGALDSWRADNTDATVPILKYGYYANDDLSSAYIFDASYLRLKALTLDYTFPKAFVKNYFNSAKIYLAGSNLLTFTKYPGLDPESSNTTSITGPGLDYSSHPFARSITLGVKLGI